VPWFHIPNPLVNSSAKVKTKRQQLKDSSSNSPTCNSQSTFSFKAIRYHLSLPPPLPYPIRPLTSAFITNLFPFTMSSQSAVNGVSLDSVVGLVNAVKEDSSKANTVWKASTDWAGGFTCQNKIRDFEYTLDEPEGLGGSNSGPNMVEAVAAAYGSCLTVGYVLSASTKGIDVSSLSIDVEGQLDLNAFLGIKDGNAGFTSVVANVDLQSGADAATLRSIHDAVVKTSPVGNILQRAIDVSVELAPAKKSDTDKDNNTIIDLENNGVPVSAVEGLVSAVTGDSSKAATSWKAATKWQGALHSTNTIRQHSPVSLDEPPALGGENKGPNMVEYILGAYTACLTVGYVLNASRRGLKVNRLHVDAEGHLDLHPFLGLKEGNAGFSTVKALVDIDIDATEDQLKDLHETVVRTSPVGNILQRELPVKTILKQA